MQQWLWYAAYAYVFVFALVVSAVLTALARRAAHRWEIYDHPADHKIHSRPTPLLGGAALAGTVLITVVVNLGVLGLLDSRVPLAHWLNAHIFAFLGTDVVRKLAGLFVGGALIFLLGLVDDLVRLRPEHKLVGQIVAALIMVCCGVRIQLFIPNPWIGGFITLCWIVLMSNSFNLLDNMDGLCAGVTAIISFMFFLAVYPQGQTFTGVMLLAMAGSACGFLFHNFNPAAIFMGDAGSMFCGYVIASLAVISTFYTGEEGSRVAVLVPVLVMAVPLFDTLSIIFIRIKHGESIMKGDKRHFSHRLVDLGMTERQAVVFIYLVTLVTGLGATVLLQVNLRGGLTLVAQSLGVFAIIVLLMTAGRSSRRST